MIARPARLVSSIALPDLTRRSGPQR